MKKKEINNLNFSFYSKDESQQLRQKLVFKKSIFPFNRKIDLNSANQIESPIGRNRKKSILKNRSKKESSAQFDSAEDDFETFMNLFNSSKNGRKSVNN